MKFYAIRHKATGKYMPQLKGKGYSHWNPNSTKPENQLSYSKLNGCPRLFSSKKRATNTISQWNACPNSYYGHNLSYFGSETTHLEIAGDGRSKDDLEVVEVNIKVKLPNKPFWENIQYNE